MVMRFCWKCLYKEVSSFSDLFVYLESIFSSFLFVLIIFVASTTAIISMKPIVFLYFYLNFDVDLTIKHIRCSTHNQNSSQEPFQDDPSIATIYIQENTHSSRK